jgi:hypothetical protein
LFSCQRLSRANARRRFCTSLRASGIANKSKNRQCLARSTWRATAPAGLAMRPPQAWTRRSPPRTSPRSSRATLASRLRLACELPPNIVRPINREAAVRALCPPGNWIQQGLGGVFQRSTASLRRAGVHGCTPWACTEQDCAVQCWSDSSYRDVRAGRPRQRERSVRRRVRGAGRTEGPDGGAPQSPAPPLKLGRRVLTKTP